MKVTIEINPGTEEAFLHHLAEARGYCGSFEDIILDLIYEQFREHVDFRVCSNPECMNLLNPIFTVSDLPYVPNEFCRYTCSPTPQEVCPKCKVESITWAESLRRQAEEEALEALEAQAAECDDTPVRGARRKPRGARKAKAEGIR